MKTKILPACLALLAIAAVATAADKVAVEYYVNMKFGYSVAFTREIFIPQGEAANGSGQRFLSKDGKALVSVYGFENTGNRTLLSVFDETVSAIGKEAPDWKMTYKHFKSDHFVLKGVLGDKAFLKKVTHKPREGQWISFEAIWPVSKDNRYDRIVSTMANSLKIVKGPDAGK